MATIIDSLIVVLGLDSSGFDKGRKQTGEGFKKTRDEAEKTGKNLEQFGKKATNFFSSLRNEAIGLFLAFQGASSLQGFVSNMITGDAATGRLAKNLGMTTTELSAYGLAIKSVGGDASEANAAFGLLAQSREQLKLTGTTGHDREFTLMGFGQHDLDDTAKAFDKLALAAQKMPRTQFYNLAHQLGLSDGVINLLELGPAKMRELVKAREADAAASEKQAEASAALQARWADLVAKITAIMRPEIYKLVDGLLDLVGAMTSGTESAASFNAGLIVVAGAAALLASPFVAAGAAIVLLLANLDKLKVAYAHAIWYTHGLIGGHEGRNLYLEMYNSGVRNTDDIDKRIAADQAGAPSGGGGGGGGSSPAGTSYSGTGFAGVGGGIGNTKAGGAYIEDYLKRSGFSPEQAKGVAAGIAAEGGGLGMAANGAFGIGQWRGGRKKALFAKYGNAPSMAQQMDFLVSELRGGDAGGAKVTGQFTASGALEAYIKSFMRPGPGVDGDLRRGYRHLGQVYGGGSGGSAGGGASTTVSIGTITLPGVKDADGFAAALPHAIRRRGLTTQANKGLD